MQIIINELKKELKTHGSYQFPLLVSYEILSKYDSHEFLSHWHPEIEITLIQEGTMIYTINNTSFHLHKGEGILGNSNSLHSGRVYKDKDCKYISITFDPKLIYGYENSIIYSEYVEPIIKNCSLSSIYFDLSEEWHSRAISIIKDIILTSKQSYKFHPMDIVCNLYEFWKLVFSNIKPITSITASDKRNYDRILNILSYIEENYSSKLSLESVSNHINLCKSECCRLFKRYMKISLFEFILNYRIDKSLGYLINSNYSIVDIAIYVGFNDSNYFSKVFKKVKGCSPSDYRKFVLHKL